jgi:dTDP-4-dehydrorhamnose reductase
MRRLANERDELRIVDDQIGVPNDSEALAAVTVQLVAQGKTRIRERAGLYHLSATGETSWFGFAQAIFAALPADNKRPRLIPITTAEYPLPAIRPAYGVLSSEKLRQTFNITLPSWQTMLQACLAQEIGYRNT